MEYKDWLAYKSRLEGRDASMDEHDYDLKSYFETLKANPVDGGHLPDTFKKPNHPTFSDQSKFHVPVVKQGGHWEGDEFTPSEHNLKNMSAPQMQGYFNEVEKPENLNLPNEARVSALRKLSGR